MVSTPTTEEPRTFLIPNSFIHARVYVREGWVSRETGKKGDPRLQYSNIQLLHDVMGLQAKKLTLQIPIGDIKKDKVRQLKDLLRMHKGDKQLHITLYDMEDELKLNMPSRKQKVAISKELLEELKELEFSYKLN